MVLSYRGRSILPLRTKRSVRWGLAPAWIALLVIVAVAAPVRADLDLRIQFMAFTAPLPGPVVGEAFPVLVTVVNDGSETSPPFSVHLWKNTPSRPTSAAGADEQVTVDGLAPGVANARTIQFDLTYDSPGNYFVWAVIDVDNVVAEFTDDNNSYSMIVPVAASAPDLIIESIVPDVDAPVVGQPFTVAVTVKNQGRLAAGPFNVAVFKNSQAAPTSAAGSDADMPVASLAAGGTAILSFDAVYDAAGEYTFWALADSGRVVTQSDTANDAASVIFTIGDGSGGEPSGGGICGRGVGPANLIGFYALCVAGLIGAKWHSRITRRAA